MNYKIFEYHIDRQVESRKNQKLIMFNSIILFMLNLES